MPANPEILSSLNEHVYNKTGKRVLDLGAGDPPTGGDKDKGKGGAPSPTPSNRIPLPDYNNPASRIGYAKAWTAKYGHFMEGRGDTPLRINEVPYTPFDKLTAKQSALQAAKRLGLNPATFYSSAMEEGMSGVFKKGVPGETPFANSGDPQYPLSGFLSFGLDNFGSYYPGLVKKGYLSADFKNKFHAVPMTNEKGQSTLSGDFRTVEDVLQAKAAMVRNSQDEMEAYAAKNKIPLSPRAKEFFSLVHYNAGEGNAQKMLMDYHRAGALANDAFLNERPTKGVGLTDKSWKIPYENVIRRVKMARALENEGYFDAPSTAPAPQQPPITVTSK